MKDGQGAGAARDGAGHVDEFDHSLPSAAHLVDHRAQLRIQHLGDDLCALLVGMDAVGLIERRIAGDALEQKRHERDLSL